MTEYVAGFLFTNINGSTPSVVLIRKNRGPAGMKGKLNAVEAWEQGIRGASLDAS